LNDDVMLNTTGGWSCSWFTTTTLLLCTK